MPVGFTVKDAKRIGTVVKRIENTPLGDRSLRGKHKTHGSGGLGSAIIKITGKTNYQTYTADVYGNGKHNTATETGVTVKATEIGTSETVSSDRYFLATKQTWDDGSGNDVKHYTFDVPRSL